MRNLQRFAKILRASYCGADFVADVAKLQRGPAMSIETVLLILIMTLAMGVVLNRLDATAIFRRNPAAVGGHHGARPRLMRD